MYRVSEDILAAQVPDGVAILNTKTSRYYTLNSVGEFIWNTLRAGSSRERIIEQIIETYDVDCERAEADANDLLTTLLEAGLITKANGSE